MEERSFGLELVRKAFHIFTGVAIVLLFSARLLDIWLFGLLIIAYAALMLYNLRYEKELLMKVISINRADRDIPGLDILAYFIGCWMVLAVFHTPENRIIAYAAIMVLAIGDPVAHIVSKSFGATQVMVTKTTYIQGTVAGIIAGTLAASLYVSLLPAFIASVVAMIIEAGEMRISSHHIDDNLTIPVSAALTLWVISLAFGIA